MELELLLLKEDIELLLLALDMLESEELDELVDVELVDVELVDVELD